jgi:hypothetical protein
MDKEDPIYLKLTGLEENSGKKSFYYSDSDQSRSIFQNLNGLHIAETMINIIRGIFLDLEKPFEEYKKDCVTFLDYFESDRKGHHQFLLREFLVCENVQERLRQIQNHIFLRYVFSVLLTVTTVNEVLSQGRFEHEMSLLLKNILISCRLLPERKQKSMYEDLGDMFLRAKTIARIHGQEFPKMESFFPLLFDFDVAPVSYYRSELEEHKTTFFETMASLTDVVLISIVDTLEDFRSVADCIKVMLRIVDPTISYRNFTESLLLKMGREASQLKLVKDFIYEESHNYYLSFFIYAIYAWRLDPPEFKIFLKKCLDAFKSEEANNRKFKIILSRELCSYPTFIWKPDHLSLARLIHKNSTPQHCTSILLAVYRGFAKDKNVVFQEIYSSDIVKGLKSDLKSWCDVLEGFLVNRKTLRHWSVYAPYCVPLKMLLTTRQLQKEELQQMLMLFCKILIICNIDSNEDWTIIANHTGSLNRATLNLIYKDLKRIPSDESVIESLITASMKAQDLDSKSFSGLFRFFNKSQQPLKLTLTFLNHFQRFHLTVNFNGYMLWAFVVFIAEKARYPEVYELLMELLFERYNNYYGSWDNNCNKILWLITRYNICTSRNFIVHRNTLFTHLSARLEAIRHNTVSDYFLASAVVALKPEYKERNSMVSEERYLLHKYMTQPPDLSKIPEFVKNFGCILTSSIEQSASKETFAYIIINIIKNIQCGPNFAAIRETLVAACFRCHPEPMLFAPVCLLAEARYCLKEEQSIPENIRSFLLSPEMWYKEPEVSNWSIAAENRIVLTETQKLFRNKVYNGSLVNFAVSLYFLEIEIDENRLFSVSILAQLAK